MLRGRAAENFLLRPPSPDSGGSGEGSTDKSSLTAPSETPNKKPNTPQQPRSTRKSTPSNNASNVSVVNTLKAKINSSRKGMSVEELEMERVEIDRMVNDLESLGPRDKHVVFRSLPAIDDGSAIDEDAEAANRILQPQEHPFSLVRTLVL